MGEQTALTAVEDSLAVTVTLNAALHDPAVALLGFYQVQPQTCTRMFPATLFIIAKNWKQRRCPLVGEWMNCGTFRQRNLFH